MKERRIIPNPSHARESRGGRFRPKPTVTPVPRQDTKVPNVDSLSSGQDLLFSRSPQPIPSEDSPGRTTVPASPLNPKQNGDVATALERIAPPADWETLDMPSSPNALKELGREIHTKRFQPTVTELLDHLRRLPCLDGLAFVVESTYHLEVYAFTRLQGDNSGSAEGTRFLEDHYLAFKRKLHKCNPLLTVGLSYCETDNESMNHQLNDLLSQWSAPAGDARFITVMQRPTPIA